MPTKWVVRPMLETDVSAVHALFLQALPEECWGLPALMAELANPQACVLVAVCEEMLGGFLQVRYVLEEGNVLNLAVDKALRRQGLGRLLLEALVHFAVQSHIETYTLEVRAKNCEAVAFYEAFGFVKVGRRAGFYRAPVDDALLYRFMIRTPQE